MLARDFELYYYSDTYDSFERVLLHRHDYYEFYFFLEGDVCMQIGTARHTLQPGDLVCIPPLIPHAPFLAQSSKPYRRFVFWISRTFLEDLRELSPDYAYAADWLRGHNTYVFKPGSISFNYFQSKIILLLEEMKGSRFGRSPMIQLKVDDLILEISRYFRERVQSACQSGNTNEFLYDRIRSYIEDHLNADLSLCAIADHFYLSRSYVAHLFRDQFGISVHQYILKKRLALVRDQIASGAEITKTCELAGFNDYTSFYRVFRKEYGISPKQYQKKAAVDRKKLMQQPDPPGR